MAKLKTPGKIAIVVIVAGLAFGAWRMSTGGGGISMETLIPGKKPTVSKEVARTDLPSGPTSDQGKSVNFTQPTDRTVSSSKPEVRLLLWAWNSQLGGILANGGAQTTEGSIMAKKGVNLRYIRQDDPAKMQEELVTFATELSKGNKQPEIGAHFVAIMGDGAAAFLQGINPVLKKLGPGYTARVVGSMGYSRGEDKFMGPQSWKDNPNQSKGGVTAGYLRDGDWNIALKWLGDNGLRNNPDEKTWDPDALNWVSADSYIDAAEKYVAGYTETRPVVRNGKRTGETKQVKVDSVVTWTPGDVTVAQKKGGLVSIVSTKEYSSQMPNTIIGIDKWCKDNRATVENMLSGMFEGADVIKTHPDGLPTAAKLADKVFNESGTGPEYWEKYYRGVIETDIQGLEVELGGSSVNNLADNMILFGLVPGSQNLFEATYTVFGNIVKQQYPEFVPTFPPISEALDVSYVKALASRSAPTSSEIVRAKESGGAVAPKVKSGATISKKSWRITFLSGKADFTPQAATVLQRLLNDLLIAGNTAIEIHGHTDNVGNAQGNMTLSERRAFAVKSWIEKRAPVNFPKGKIQVFAHGQTNPLVPNTSDANKAQNRRVDIVLRAAN